MRGDRIRRSSSSQEIVMTKLSTFRLVRVGDAKRLTQGSQGRFAEVGILTQPNPMG